MGVREFLNNNSAVVTIAAVVVLVVALGLIIMQSRGPRRGGGHVDAYFYDIGTGRIFVSSAAQLAPIEAPSGPYEGRPAGVRAYVFACEACGDYDGMSAEQVREHGAQVGWLEKYDPEAKEQFATGMHPGPMAMMDKLIKAVDAENWNPSSSPEGMQLQDLLRAMCPTRRPTMCLP